MKHVPNWEDAPWWAQYLAMDECGEWYWFEMEPSHDNYCWEAEGGRVAQAFLPTPDLWKKTLERRP